MLFFTPFAAGFPTPWRQERRATGLHAVDISNNLTTSQDNWTAASCKYIISITKHITPKKCRVWCLVQYLRILLEQSLLLLFNPVHTIQQIQTKDTWFNARMKTHDYPPLFAEACWGYSHIHSAPLLLRFGAGRRGQLLMGPQSSGHLSDAHCYGHLCCYVSPVMTRVAHLLKCFFWWVEALVMLVAMNSR